MHWLLHFKQGWCNNYFALSATAQHYYSYTKQDLECRHEATEPAWLSRIAESPVLWPGSGMVNWSMLTSNVYYLATGEADRNNKLMPTC